jgi:hypothetical protein
MGEWRENVRLAPVLCNDVLHAHILNQERVRDQEAVTAPRNHFGTHRYAPLRVCEFHDSVNTMGKVRTACSARNRLNDGLWPDRGIVLTSITLKQQHDTERCFRIKPAPLADQASLVNAGTWTAQHLCYVAQQGRPKSRHPARQSSFAWLG